jgi:hypothetical protein
LIAWHNENNDSYGCECEEMGDEEVTLTDGTKVCTETCNNGGTGL